MGPENSSLIGWVLGIVGVALAIIAYAIYINLRGDDEEQDLESTEEKTSTLADETEDTQTDHSLDDINRLSTSENGDEEPDSGESSDTSSNGREEKGKESLKSMPVKPEDQELIPIATILREADTGRMVLRINDEEFSSPAALKESDNWFQAERLQAEFSNWLNESLSSSGDELKAKSEQVARGKANEDQGMIPQINRIIEHKVSNMEGDQQSVRLVEDVSGSLKVLVGVETFPFDAVPYEEIRELIQESVDEWEAKQ